MGETIKANGAESLRNALKTAEAETIIDLAPGDYGRLSISVPYGDPWGRFDGQVTIRSADPGNPASFSSIFLRGVENLAFDGVAIDYAPPVAILHDSAVLVQEGQNIAFRNSAFNGNVIDAPGTAGDGLPVARGIFIRESEKVVLENNALQSWATAASIQNVSDLVIRDNEVHTVRTDGLQLVGAQHVLIEGNHLHDFVTKDGLSDHRDMIQFWTANSKTPTTNVVIRDNVLHSGTGPWTQSIFMRNEAVDSQGGGQAMYYRDIVIENNTIYNAHLHGITVGEADGLKIVRNTLLYNPDSYHNGGSQPNINVSGKATDVQITNNIAGGVTAGRAGWTVADNLVVQSIAADKPNHYSDLFINALTGGGEADLAGLQALPGSIVETGGYGSGLTRFDPTPDALTAIIRPEKLSGDDFSFDGGYTANAKGLVRDGATFRWELGDGTVRQGVSIDHSYSEPGTYTVKLTVTDANGGVDTALAEAYVAEPVRLDLDVTAGGLVDLSTYGVSGLPSVKVEQAGGRYGARISDASGFGIGRGAAPIYDLDAFTISLDLRAASGPASAGEIFRLHGSMLLQVGQDGRFTFGLANDAGQTYALSSAPTKALDGGWHTVSLTYDKADGTLALFVDGVQAGQVAAGGSTKPLESWGPHFGSIWNKIGFDGLIDNFRVSDEALSPGGAPQAPAPQPPATEAPAPQPPASETPAPQQPAPETPGQEEPGPTLPGGIDVTRVDFQPGAPVPGARLFGDAAITEDGTLALDGTRDYFGLYSGQPEFTGAVSVAFDLRFDEIPHPSERIDLLSKHGQFGIDLRAGDIAASFAMSHGHRGTGAGDATKMFDGEWHRIALSIDAEADVLRLYLDGDLVTEHTGSDIVLSDSSRPLTFGSAGWNDDMTGEIDNILVANAVLDIDALM